MKNKSLFIVIEGLDGSGKTSVSRQLANVLDIENKGKIKLTFEPHDPSAGGLFIRQVLMKKIRDFSPKTLALIFAANRLDHCDREINPWLNDEKSKMIICDRYYLSSLVYQSSPEIPFESIFELNNQARKPDIIFFLNVSNQVCYERMKIRNQPQELFESNLSSTREKYLQAINFLRENNQDNIIEIDGSGQIEEVVALMLEKIYAYMPEWQAKQVASDSIAPQITSLNDNIAYTIQDFIQDLAKEWDIQQLETSIYTRFNSLTNSQLASVFLDYLRLQNIKIGKKMALASIDAYELEYQMPFNLLLRGVALIMPLPIKYEEILKIVPDLYKMSDFMLIFSPGPSELVTKHYERDKIKFNTQNPQEGLFPSTQLITQADIAQLVFTQYSSDTKFSKTNNPK